MELRRQAQAARECEQGDGMKFKPANINPRTKLPEEHPESQAVEREHYKMQTSLCGLPIDAVELDKKNKQKE